MEHGSSETQDFSPKDELTVSEASTRSPFCEHTFPGDSDLRSTIGENAIQVLSQGFFLKGPRYTVCVSELDKDNDFFSLTVPRKLWKIAESDQFKSNSWDENGTCIVIYEEHFKKEILERKNPCRIFQTDSIKSFVRQLNIYGFSKIRPNFQRSAFLPTFLAKEKESCVLNKLKCYYNPNFKRGCPQLLVRVKRRINVKNASLTPTLFHEDFNQRPFREGANMEKHNPALAAEVSEESLFSTSTNLNMSLTRESSVGKIIASSSDPILCGFPPPSRSTSIGPSEQSATDQRDILNQLSAIHMHSHSTYMQARGRIVNFITTTTSQYHIISPFQNSFLQLIVESPAVPMRYPAVSVNQAPHPNLLPAGHRWLQMSAIADISSSPLSRPATQPSPLDKYHTSYN
ncbi:LOW QUALITY PROTEIN: heat shock transcription factor, Y-linked-like [Rhinopithecus roxellana]|uniref:LOW QUALITY PROTEIN: heat shock transcription factor, Y-linked-like n=1 Tax=Rhinopithecus roxellana TaxID=61622 RepID=UPI001237571E|nr:LOW QUALITY PROTEIN: heat shock transcription factor, Y-linked-like [Rhinopithecus roxellana]